MTKLELSISATTLAVVSCVASTEKALQCSPSDHVSTLLSDASEFEALKAAIEKIVASDDNAAKPKHSFQTLNLVFKAPGVEETALVADRTPIEAVFRSPLEAMHMCGSLEIAAFAHLSIGEDGTTIQISALEYSREHRKGLLRQEFGSWLLEEHIEKAVIATTVMGEVVFWNRFASELYQYSCEEVIGRSIMELTPSEMTAEQGQEIMGRLMQGQHWKGYFGVKRRDKSNFMAHVTDTPIMGPDGSVKFIVGVSADYTQVHDLTAQLQQLNASLEKEVERRTEQLVEREKLLRLVGVAMKASETGVMITNDQNEAMWLNDAFVNLLSCKEEDLVGLNPRDLPLLKDNKQWTEFFDRPFGLSYQSAPCAEIDVRGLLPIDYLLVSVQIVNLEESEQQLVTVRNISATKRAEALQLEAQKASAMSQTKSEMMQMLSHELRSPLQGIMGTTSTMISAMHPATEIYDEMSTILASSRLLLTLINTVLDVRKIDANMMQQFRLTPVSIFHAMESSVKFCLPFAAQQDIDLQIVLSGNETEKMYNVMGDRLRMEQVMVNLLTNSVKYTVPGTAVLLSARKVSARDAVEEASNAVSSDIRFLSAADLDKAQNETGDRIILSIRDYGKGIPKDEYAKVFGEFSQLSISEEKDSEYGLKKSALVGQSAGSGLGLNLVMKFVTAMNGHVWFNNCTDGPGVTFSFCLPRCNEQPKVKLPSRTNLAAFSDNVGERFRVLVVDDSRLNVKVISKMFSRLGCTEIKTANRGSHAIEYLESSLKPCASSFMPNLIISDLNMPEMSGYELMVHIQELHISPRPIVMAWSADWAPEVEGTVTSAGFDGVMRKPITILDLEELLTRLVDQEENPQAPGLGEDYQDALCTN